MKILDDVITFVYQNDLCASLKPLCCYSAIVFSVFFFFCSMIMSMFLLSKDVDRDISTTKIPQSVDKNTDTDEFGSPLRNGLLLSNKPCKETHTTDAAGSHGEKTFEPTLQSHTGILYHSTCEVTDDRRKPAVTQCSEPLHKELTDPAMPVPHCERLCPLFEGKPDVNSSVLEAALSQAFCINPLVMVMDDPPDTEGSIHGNREHFSMFEHSYSRPDTGKHQLWRKIFSLHAKILELDRREESTVAKIHALETEISHLKRDSAVCKEKQKMFEDIMSSKLE